MKVNSQNSYSTHTPIIFKIEISVYFSVTQDKKEGWQLQNVLNQKQPPCAVHHFRFVSSVSFVMFIVLGFVFSLAMFSSVTLALVISFTHILCVLSQLHSITNHPPQYLVSRFSMFLCQILTVIHVVYGLSLFMSGFFLIVTSQVLFLS